MLDSRFPAVAGPSDIVADVESSWSPPSRLTWSSPSLEPAQITPCCTRGDSAMANRTVRRQRRARASSRCKSAGACRLRAQGRWSSGQDEIHVPRLPGGSWSGARAGYRRTRCSLSVWRDRHGERPLEAVADIARPGQHPSGLSGQTLTFCDCARCGGRGAFEDRRRSSPTTRGRIAVGRIGDGPSRPRSRLPSARPSMAIRRARVKRVRSGRRYDGPSCRLP